MQNNFFQLLKYTKSFLNHYDESQAKNDLEYWIKHPNNAVFDIIDYEKLIYIELNFPDSLDIQELIQQLKVIIAENYLQKKQLMNRLILNNEMKNDIICH